MVSDADPARRSAFVAQVIRDLAPTAGLVQGRLEHGDTTVLWAAAPTAPLSTFTGADGCALLLGDALAIGTDQRLHAEALFHDRRSDLQRQPSAYDGFHVGIVIREAELAISGDLLGLAPIVYAATASVFIAGSSSALFARHPLFEDAIDTRGLFGHLLTGGPFDGRTVRAGVTRLGAGRLLRRAGGAPPQAVRCYHTPPAGVETSLDFDAAIECYDAALHAAVRRQSAAHERVTLLLSGGRDSRLLGGYTVRDRPLTQALTLGAHTDHDAICAVQVARVLHTPHRVHDVPFDHFPLHADRSVRLELLAGGMSNVHAWEGVTALQGRDGGGVLSGYLLEVRQTAPLPQSCAGMLDWTFAHAMTPRQLRELVRPELRAQVDEVAEAVAVRLDAYGAECGAGAQSNERSWRWMIATNARFHAGAIPWRLTAAAWPILPILDQNFLRILQSLPPAWLDSRGVQDAILRRRFPGLARLPLDRNANDRRPLAPTLGYRLRDALQNALGPHQPPAVEQRYYARMYDFDNPGWQRIRAAAEAGRDTMATWFDPDALARLVPRAGQRAAHADPIADGFAPKLLVGCMLALAQRREAAA